MFRQILCQQLKTLRFTNVLGTHRTSIIPQLIDSRLCHTILNDDSLNNLIDRLRHHVENESKISDNLMKNLSKDLEESKVDADQSIKILRYCANGTFYNDPSAIVNDIWNQLKIQNEPKIQHYITMMQFCQRWRNSVKLRTFFDDMIEAKIKPNALAYQLLFNSYCRDGNVQKATDVWENMISENYHNHERVYHGLIQCHILSGQIEIANLIFMEMKKMGYKPNFFVLESFLQHYTKENDIANIKETFDIFAENGAPLGAKNVLNVMYQLSKNGAPEHIDNLMEYLKPLKDKTEALRRTLDKLIKDADAPLIHTFLSKISHDLDSDSAYVIERMVQNQVRDTFFDEVMTQLQSLGITMETHFDRMKPVLNGPSIEIIWKMLHFMKSQSHQVNENHFIHLLSLSAKSDSHYFRKTVKIMCSEFDVQPQITTIRNIIMPGIAIGSNNIRKILDELRSIDIRYGRCVMALMSANLMNGRLATAYMIASDRGHDSFYYGTDLITRPLLQAYDTTKDINTFVRLAKIVHKSIENYDSYKMNDANRTEAVERSVSDLQADFINQILQKAAQKHCNGQKRIEPLVGEFENEGFPLTSEQVQFLRNSLGNVTTKMDFVLDKFTAGTVKAKPIQMHYHLSITLADTQKRIAKMKKIGNKNSIILDRRLYNAYLMEGNMAGAKSLVENEKLKLFPSDYAQLINAHVKRNELVGALDALKEAQKSVDSFKLLGPKSIAKLVTLMIDSKCSFDEIEAILIANKREQPLKDNSIFAKIFNRLVSTGNAELLNKIHDAAVTNGHIKATPSSTRFLVGIHLSKNRIEEAVAAYERIGNNYKTLPMTVALMTAIIEKKKFGMLEDVYSTYKKVYGNHSAALNLAFTYIKCGYHRQAEFIFNDHQIKNLSQELVHFCEYFQKNNGIKELQTLLKATQNALCDRNSIYESLLNIYFEKNDIESAVRLWQEYDCDTQLNPSKSFESKLKVLMRKNDIHLTMDSLRNESNLQRFVINEKAVN